ncbi:MAG: sodium:calcium antiporter [Candidatus Aenigmatarchaeota archaeon]
MELIFQILIFFTSIIILSVGSNVVVKSAEKFARITKLGDLVIGFIVLSIVTTTPELAISFSSITSGDIEILISNLFGSNITVISLVIGIASIVSPITIVIRRKELKSLSLMVFLSSLLSLMFFWLGEIGKFVGIFLISTFFYFSYYSVKKKVTIQEIKEELNTGKIYSTALTLCLGIFIVMISARFVVISTSNIADITGIKESVIGATIISFGCSIPEFSITVTAAKKKKINLALGTAMGSCLTRLTLVLGVSLLLIPFIIDVTIFSTLITFCLLSTILLWHFIGDGKIQIKEGLILLLIYVFFILTTCGVQISMFVGT